METHLKKDPGEKKDVLVLPPLKTKPAPDPLKLVQLPPEPAAPATTLPKLKSKQELEPVAIPDGPPASREVSPMPKTKPDVPALEIAPHDIPSSVGPITIRPATPKKTRGADS